MKKRDSILLYILKSKRTSGICGEKPASGSEELQRNQI